MMDHILGLYGLLLILQTLHIFEEIYMEAYKPVGSLKKYLGLASALVAANYVPFFLILYDVPAGYLLACITALLGIGNGLIHIAGYFKFRRFRGTLGAGMFTGIPLGLTGCVLLYRLVSLLFFS
jgi:predicted membrane channel-forming protein YqfA (hemolysin III family)